MSEVKKEITREQFRNEYPNININQALVNMKNLIDYSLASGLFKKIEELVVINKSFELMEDFIKKNNVAVEDHLPVSNP